MKVIKRVLLWARDEEPAAVAGAVVAVGAVVTGERTGHLTFGLVAAAVTAVQALFVRQNVKPTP